MWNLSFPLIFSLYRVSGRSNPVGHAVRVDGRSSAPILPKAAMKLAGSVSIAVPLMLTSIRVWPLENISSGNEDSFGFVSSLNLPRLGLFTNVRVGREVSSPLVC